MAKRPTATEAEPIAATVAEYHDNGFPAVVRHASPSEVASKSLDDWFTGYIHGTALSRNTRAYNEAHASYQRLRGLLSHLDD